MLTVHIETSDLRCTSDTVTCEEHRDSLCGLH